MATPLPHHERPAPARVDLAEHGPSQSSARPHVPGRVPDLCWFSTLSRQSNNLPTGITLPVGTKIPARSRMFSGEALLGQRPFSPLLGSLLGMSADFSEGDESVLGEHPALRPKESGDQGAPRRCTCP